MLTICCGNVLPLALLDLSCASFLFGSGAPWQDPWGRDGPRPRNHLRLEMPHPLVVRRAFQGVRNLTVSHTFEHCGLFPRWKQTRDRTGTRCPREAPVPGPAHRRGRRSGRQGPGRRRGLPPRARELREGARGSPPSVLLSPPCATPGEDGAHPDRGAPKAPAHRLRKGRTARNRSPRGGARTRSLVAEHGGRARGPVEGAGGVRMPLWRLLQPRHGHRVMSWLTGQTPEPAAAVSSVGSVTQDQRGFCCVCNYSASLK